MTSQDLSKPVVWWNKNGLMQRLFIHIPSTWAICQKLFDMRKIASKMQSKWW